jgi:hypothetical protein|tara:strand:- start:636 stop:767 length:132 start_codon:yes stop_codon:yes gene_type:complete
MFRKVVLEVNGRAKNGGVPELADVSNAMLRDEGQVRPDDIVGA